MKVLVTGATGGLGRNALEFLRAKGIEVRATGRNPNIGAELAAEGFEFVPCELSSTPPAVQPLLDGIDAVWHCAALSSPWGRKEDFERANVVATRNLGIAAGRAGVRRFIHISTPSLYFDYRHHHDLTEVYVPHAYVNQYAKTKAKAEMVVHRIASDFHEMKAVILRPRGIFGRHDQALIPRIERVIQERKGRVPLPRAGKALVDLTYAENVVHAMWLATLSDTVASGSVFNITNAEPTTVAAILDQLFRNELGQEFSIASVPYRVLDGFARVLEAASALTGREPLLTRYSAGTLNFDMTLDISKARGELGYEPLVSVAEGVARTAEWMRKRG
jgi:nucleoside-diphosphate-sugar epimerase